MARKNGNGGRDVIIRVLEELSGLRAEFHEQATRADGRLKRIARLIGEMADRTRQRFDELEDRVAALERR